MHPRTQIAAPIDTAIVVAFVSIGRRSHHEDDAIASVAQTAAPFLIALAVAWIVWRVWVAPDTIGTGIRVWATTVALGMVLRNLVFDDGTATSFVIVATAFLGTFLVGWRVVATVLAKRASSGALRT